MPAKSEFLQIRVTPGDKVLLKRMASEAGQDVSTYVMARALPAAGDRFREIVGALPGDASPTYGLAELNDFLHALPPREFPSAVATAPLEGLSPFLRSYVAAMVEVAAGRKGQTPPAWTAQIEGPNEPWFATPMKGLRLHLLRSSPGPFKRRNLFVDATVGDRV